jgi:hypothetical protein
MIRILSPIFAAALLAACRTTSIKVPDTLKVAPLGETANACAAAYELSDEAAARTEAWTAALTITTGVGVATTGLAAGMASAVDSEAAKKNWAYVSVGALAVTTLVTGINLWLNAPENASQQRQQASNQATHLFNAGYLMSCTTEGRKAAPREGGGKDQPAPVEPAFCSSAPGQRKGDDTLRDEAYRELALCLRPASWAYGPVPSNVKAPPGDGAPPQPVKPPQPSKP